LRLSRRYDSEIAELIGEFDWELLANLPADLNDRFDKNVNNLMKSEHCNLPPTHFSRSTIYPQQVLFAGGSVN
jgi:hypothetical protein